MLGFSSYLTQIYNFSHLVNSIATITKAMNVALGMSLLGSLASAARAATVSNPEYATIETAEPKNR